MDTGLVIGGHRGNGCTDHIFYHARGQNTEIATENTLAAFTQAFANGADYIETDIVMSADGILFTLHNVVPTDHFFSNDKPATLLNQLPYREIEKYKTGRHGTGQLTTLADTLAIIAKLDPKTCDWAINLEIKGVQGSNQPYEENGFLSRIAETVLQSALPEDRIIFSSFALENIVCMSRLLPRAKYGMLFSERPHTARPIYTNSDNRLELSYLPFTENYIKQALHYWQQNTDTSLGYLHPEITTLDTSLIELASKKMMGLNVWAYMEVLDEQRKSLYAERVEQAQAAGVAISLITDYINVYR